VLLLLFLVAGNCCPLLEFTSTGSLASGVQSHILGVYEYESEGPDGRTTYVLPENQFGDPIYLYWYPPLDVSGSKNAWGM
jgi:hypothetical protein